ncbi:hypothetical protein [Carnobacterium jeotgali]|uniref:hypothetical protein n=1 Tax=Carnobacterium jeotgali TaxID=545534 RepID=UPI000B008785|nr:hypothetical protein [Carnobacterium jeotgali]
MKKGWLIVGLAVVLIGIGGGVFFMGQPGKNVHISENGLSYVAKVEGKDFYIFRLSN